MLNVLLTVDTEVYPLTPDWKENGLRIDIQRDIFGKADGRELGLKYQIEVLSKYGLKGIFMVESLFASVPAIGIEPLVEIVQEICNSGHEAQLHVHPEWVPYIPGLGVVDRGYLMTSYPENEQAQIVRAALSNLRAAGVPQVTAFRAGDYAANLDTIAALVKNGLRFDCSYNAAYAPQVCQLPCPATFGTIMELSGVFEMPVAAFQDYPGHFRPAQLAACSGPELIHAIEAAERDKWDCFVIVFHSFEMLKNRRHKTRKPSVRNRVVDRFHSVCSYLSRNRDRFRVVGFADVGLSHANKCGHIKGKLVNTALRIAEQMLDRIVP